MPLNKLDNFIKNTEGRILYVSPADLDSTDSIDNTGNSLARPFKTIQRAILESARFSYVKGNNNDSIEKTTILLMPGEHVIDNRPGFYIKDVGGTATVVSRSGADSAASSTLDLNLNTNFDLTQEDNILYKFNSVFGGVIVPRGTSIVGLDLRKTKLRPLYIPNPTDVSVENSAIFRITGTCYFWQFSFFDGNENSTVYTDSNDFSTNKKSKPIFSHHKLTCFEYADGVNNVVDYSLTDLDMYYAKLGNAYNTGSGSPDRNIDSKYPSDPDGFAKQRPEWEIVGAFASDPISINNIESGDGGTPNNQVTVTTTIDHGLTVGTPIKISGVNTSDYNISTKVQSVDPSNPRIFTYLLPTFRKNLPANPSAAGAEVTIETDTVSGASPYIFNISLRSVFGMNGMHADGSKASGFRSMVVAQFTGVSLQKDDRSFVKYDKTSRAYAGITISDPVFGADLSNGSSSTDPNQIYHLDSEAVYRQGWEQTHIRVSNDAILQIVSVFAIGYNKHFAIESGGDASITNSNSNFGQLSLVADGFRKEAFVKDNKAFITNVIPPRSSNEILENIDWLTIDVGITTNVGVSTHLYLSGFDSLDSSPPVLTQGFRVGAKTDDKLFVDFSSVTGYGVSEANIYMQDATTSAVKQFDVTAVADSKLTIGLNNGLQTGEKVILLSDNADYPENIQPHIVYFVISLADAADVADRPKIQLARTKTDADNQNSISFFGGTELRVLSRVSDKNAGEPGHPVQFDDTNGWYVTVDSSNQIYSTLDTLGVAGIGAATNPTLIKRAPDNRSLDEKIYKFRVVIPKELENAKTPESGFVIQESSTTGFTSTAEANFAEIGLNNFEYERNNRFISTCSHNSDTSTVVTELPHNLDVNDQVIITNVTDTNNTVGSATSGYNGTFTVATVNADNMSFTYNNPNGNPGSFNNDTSTRNLSLPRFQRNNLQSNFYVYRNEIINEYIENQQDGVYHIYALKADNAITSEFTNLEYGQNVVDLYPQTDRDNVEDNPGSTKSRALSFPIGDVNTSDLKGSITRESADAFVNKLGGGLTVDSILPLSSGISTITFNRNHRFAGISTATLSSVGSGTRTDGTYFNVKLYDDNSYSTWRGATAKVVVSSNAIDSFQIQSPGSGYSDGNTLFFDNVAMGGGQDGEITVSNSGITTNVGDVVQVTGIATISDAYYRITDVPTANRIAIAQTSGDSPIKQGHLVINVGPSISVNSTEFSSGITTFTCSSAHGLVAGNKFRVIDNTNNNLGDYLVKSRVDVNSFAAETTKQLTSPTFILKHYFSSNAGVSDASNENLAGRQSTFFAGDTLTINNSGNLIGVTTNLIPVSHPNSGAATGVGITERFPLGTYVQVDDEIMRVSSSTLTGTDKLVVLRGVLSSNVGIHSDTSLIKKINPLPVEFRRPSIIRASGHTFEYLGYGPGNYSTGLPQVQTRTLTEREEFLSQSQERSAGIVVYTGMNNRGDFYIGNTKKSSSTGEETSFDTPIPTVTGEDPARLSAIFDEITVKERIIVEGGDSRQILSQFDGPVTFGNEVRIKNKLSLSSELSVKSTTQSTNSSTGAITVEGGVGVGGDVHVGGEMFFPDDKKLNFGNSNDLQISHQSDFSSQLDSAGNQITTGSASLIEDALVDDGPLVFKSSAGTGQGAFQFFDLSWNPKLKIFSGDDSGVLLYHGNSGLKFETISTGAKVSGELQVTDDITAFYSSDERLKDNIAPIDDPLAKVISISGNTFDWNENTNNEGSDTGVIAQEIEALGLPGLVTTRDNGYKAVRYEKLVPLLVEAIKELSGKVDVLEQKLSDK